MRFLLLLLLILVTLFSPSSVSAHVLKASGNIGAVMHITPEDDPIAGEQSDFFFEFKDKDGKFKGENCDCTAAILSSGEEIYKQPLFTNNPDSGLSSASFSYTFPKAGVYKVKVEGKPRTGNEFNNFTLEYDLRIERVSEKSGTGSGSTKEIPKEDNWLLDHVTHLGGGLVIAGFLILALMAKNKRKAAVIILAFALVAHSFPVKAIHASHESGFVHESYACCIPVNAVIPERPVLNLPEDFAAVFEPIRARIIRRDSYLRLFIRPPPFS